MRTHTLAVGRTLVQALAALVLVPALAGAQSPAAAIHDGVVVDAAGGTAYITGPNGDLAAIDLATGTERWTSGAAARPLAVTDSTLVAQASPGAGEQLVVVSIDTERGAEKRRAKVALPNNLQAAVTDSASQRTLVRGFLAGAGNVVVSWAIESRIARGAAVDDDTPDRASGAARIDPETGASVAVPADSVPDTSALSGLTLDGMMQLRSADGQHLLRSQRSGDPLGPAPYRWTVTTASGEVVGVVGAATSVAPFVVSGSRLLHVAAASGYRDGDRFVQEPLRLRAVDLASGAQLWTVPVRDTSSVLPPP
ncbi:MAG: hypothetical protein ACRD26_19865 [Vicinamibacterales bacterium]